MKKKIKVAIVGSNFGLKCYLPVVKKINKLDLKVICSRNIDKIKKNLNDIKNFDCIDDWKEIFKKNIDILVCAVPPKVQEKILIYNLKFKKKIIFEKPISSNLKKSIKLVENLKKNKINCEVNLTYLFHPLFKKVKNIGNPIETSKSLKKLISSKIFSMKANVKKTKTVLTNVNMNCLLI